MSEPGPVETQKGTIKIWKVKSFLEGGIANVRLNEGVGEVEEHLLQRPGHDEGHGPFGKLQLI